MSASKRGQIDSDRVVIRELFSRFWFCIPDYQRAYVWGKDEISELIDDVTYASRNNPQGQYFLGSMVLRRVEAVAGNSLSFEEHELLDGQQRLTTLMLMLACVRDRVADSDLKDTCREMLYQKENKWKNIPGRTRLLYNIRDEADAFLERYVKADGATKSADLPSLRGSKNVSLANMAAAMQIIHSCFDDTERFGTLAEFDRFVGYLLNNALFIYVSTEDLDDAFRLFTILNDRGIPLSNSDIIKARNLGAVSNGSVRTKWAEFWEEAEARWDGMSSIVFFLMFAHCSSKTRRVRDCSKNSTNESMAPSPRC